jgi:hypothetical protein
MKCASCRRAFKPTRSDAKNLPRSASSTIKGAEANFALRLRSQSNGGAERSSILPAVPFGEQVPRTIDAENPTFLVQSS